MSISVFLSESNSIAPRKANQKGFKSGPQKGFFRPPEKKIDINVRELANNQNDLFQLVKSLGQDIRNLTTEMVPFLFIYHAFHSSSRSFSSIRIECVTNQQFCAVFFYSRFPL